MVVSHFMSKAIPCFHILVWPIWGVLKEERNSIKMDQEQVEMVGRMFVDRYYQLFDNDRASVSLFYQPNSMLNFEGQKILGVDNISSKLNQLPFEKCRHDISTVDSQPSSTSTGSIVVFVSGSLQLVGEEHSLRFNQMFHLVPFGQESFFVQNDIFRLNYG
uniref:NTF2 domain-containing protein n=1 Tax=Cannabis sativa TaxID=3483 RepID=A0A803NZT9_CANSA